MPQSRMTTPIPEELTDEALMVQLRQGRDTALAELLGRYENDILRFCFHYVREADTAKDLAQETFLRVYTARDRFDETRKFRPWLLCIARNLCLNDLKRKKAFPMEALDQYASKARDGHGEIMRSCIESPDVQLMAEERRQTLMNVLAELNAEHRELIILRFFHRLSAKEIAAVLGTTEGAVRTKLHRVLGALRKKNAQKKDEF